jgi:glycosyltransferase involved in cell wall biosynthesis
MGRPSIRFLLPTSQLYGGIRIPIEYAEELARRGWDAAILAPEPAPSWHDLTVGWFQVPFDRVPDLAGIDVAVGTFYPTVPLAHASGARVAVHLCQGFEGVHREYAPVLAQIEAAYSLPALKVLISEHLVPVLEERFGSRCVVIGSALDQRLFRPSHPLRPARLPTPDDPLVVGVVGPFGIRSKGIAETLEALRRVRAAGVPLRVVRASADPQTPAEVALGVVDSYSQQLPTAAMPGFYHGLDLLAFGSWDEEGFGLPPLEAMACERPVVLTDISPYRGVLPAECCVRVSWNDPVAMADAVTALAWDPARRAELARAGRAAVATMTLDRVVDRLEEALAAEGVGR